MALTDPVRIIKHEAIPDTGSFEVRFADGRKSEYFYWDDNPGRRAVTGKPNQASALQAARAMARGARAEIEHAPRDEDQPDDG